MCLGLGTLLGSLVSSYATSMLGSAYAVITGMSIIIALYLLIPPLSNLPLATIGYFILFAILGVVFPAVMEALTSLNSSIRGTISSLANSTMNGAGTLGAWLAGFIYVQFAGYSSIGVFSSICLALSLGVFVYGGVLGKMKKQDMMEETSAS